MAKNLEAYKLGVVIDANAAAALRTFAATDRAVGGLEKRFKSLKTAGESIARIGVGWSATVSAPLGLLGKTALDAAKDFDSLTRGMTAVSGSAEAAAAEIKQLKEVAKLPGLGFKEAIQGSISLQAAGLSAELARRSLGAFGNALATVGKGKAELDGVALALSQIQSKGKVSAEEINQLAERVPQIRKVMQAAFGTADTEKLQKQGIGATEFITKVVAEMEKLPKASGGAANAFENLSDSINQALVPLGNVLLKAIVPAIDWLTPKLEFLSQKFSELSPTAQAVTVGFGALAVAIGPILVGLGAVTAAIGTLGLPAVATITALGAAATALGAAWATNFGGIREITQAVFSEVREFATEQVSVIVAWWKENLPLIKQTVQTVLNGIKAFWQRHGAEITAIVKYAWQALSTTIGTVLKAVLNVIKLGMQVINGDWAGAWKTLVEHARMMVGATLKVVGLLAKQMHNLFKLMVGSLIDLQGWVLGKMAELGHWIVQGITNGIKNTATRLLTATKELALGAWQAAKDALGVRSPSRLFAELGRNVVDGFVQGIRLKENEVKKVLSDLLKEAVTTAKTIAGLSDLRVFTARNRNLDLQEQLDRAEELLTLRRELGTIPNAPNTPISGALPQGDAAIKAQIEAINALKALSEAVGRIQGGEISLFLGGLPDEAEGVPDAMREITAALDEQIRVGTKAADTYEDIKKALQGIIESYDGLSASQRIQKRIFELPADASPTQRKELEDLFNQARAAEIRDEQAREDKKNAKEQQRNPGFFERAGFGGGLFGGGDSGFSGLGQIQGATAGIKSALEELKTVGAEAFGSLAQGFGSMLETWVLTGDAGPDALRKITAQILASAAAESAVLAIVETAKGFAALAAGNPVSASQHFTSAAIFAGVAGGTAIAGRAIAGNSFNGKNNQQSNPNDAGANRDITSESYAGNRFTSGNQPLSQATYAGSGSSRTEKLLEAINNKLNPTDGKQMVLATIKSNAREVGRAAVDAVNGDFALGARFGQRATV